MWTAFALSLLGAAGTALGGVCVVALPPLDAKRLGRLQAVAAGLMLSISVTDLLPEAAAAIGALQANVAFYAGVALFAAIVALIPEPELVFGSGPSSEQAAGTAEPGGRASGSGSSCGDAGEPLPASSGSALAGSAGSSSSVRSRPCLQRVGSTGPDAVAASEPASCVARRRSAAAAAACEVPAPQAAADLSFCLPAGPRQAALPPAASPDSPASSCGGSADWQVELTDGPAGAGSGESDAKGEALKLRRRLLMSGLVTAVGIALHNLPEGAAVYLATQKSTAIGASLAVAIALHNAPEGIAVATPVYAATGSRRAALQAAVLSGLAEPAAVLLLGLALPLLGWQASGRVVDAMLAGVGGVMSFLALHELLPLAIAHAGASAAVGWLFGGMALMSLTLLGLDSLMPGAH